MKVYPKVPRYEHDFVQKAWFTEDTYVLEKYDGSNFRFGIYDGNYSDYYDEEFEHGEFILGTKKVYKSGSEIDKLNTELQEKDTEDFLQGEHTTEKLLKVLKFKDRLDYLREKVNKDKLFKLHESIDGPVLFFAENMVKHTLDYNWSEVPKLLLFDIYSPVLDTELGNKPDHPYKEKFTGFFSWIDVVRISKYIANIPTAQCIQKGIKYSDISEDIITTSEYTSGKAEGYVFRNDEQQRRVKIRTREFKELNDKVWGSTTTDSDISKTKEIAYTYTSPQRIREELFEYYTETASEDILEQVVPAIVEDFWVEEWNEICDVTFNPYQLHRYTAERVKETMLRPNLFRVPEEFKEIAEDWEYSGKYTSDPVSPENPSEYIHNTVTETVLEEKYNEILTNSDREAGNWIIEPLSEKINTYIWYTNRDLILQINSEVNCHSVTEGLYDIIVPFVKQK